MATRLHSKSDSGSSVMKHFLSLVALVWATTHDQLCSAAKIYFDKPQRYIFQHIGKAGGSTVSERIYSYGVEKYFRFCHPTACLVRPIGLQLFALTV